MNLAETAFAHPLPHGADADWALRWFTPTVEVDLCGHAIIATAPTAGPDRGYDFVSRVFGPAVGIPEDPVTGSAHTALAPYWSARLGRDDLTGVQASARTGLVRTAIHGDRVHLTGHAITVLDGTLHHTAR